LKLEIDEMMDESGPGEISDLFPDFLSGALNSPSPRFAFFTAPVEREGFTDFFLKLLDSFNRSVEVP
jgi:hypothetical protein